MTGPEIFHTAGMVAAGGAAVALFAAAGGVLSRLGGIVDRYATSVFYAGMSLILLGCTGMIFTVVAERAGVL